MGVPASKRGRTSVKGCGSVLFILFSDFKRHENMLSLLLHGETAFVRVSILWDTQILSSRHGLKGRLFCYQMMRHQWHIKQRGVPRTFMHCLHQRLVSHFSFPKIVTFVLRAKRIFSLLKASSKLTLSCSTFLSLLKQTSISSFSLILFTLLPKLLTKFLLTHRRCSYCQQKQKHAGILY